MHHRVLVAHPPSQRALQLGAQRQLGEVLAFLDRRHEALLGEVLVLEAVEALRYLVDFCAAGFGGPRGCGRGERWGGAVGGHPDRGAF